MKRTKSKRAYKFRFYPTDEQADQLVQTFGCVRYVYNKALCLRSEAWSRDGITINYFETNRMLTKWKKEPGLEWLSTPPRGPLQESLRSLQVAFERFWKKTSNFPRLKRKGVSTDSATYQSNYFTYRDGKIKLSKQKEHLDIRWSRRLPEGVAPSSVTVSRDKAGRYFISILVDDVIDHLPSTGKSVGLDAGITSLYTLSTGEKIANPRHEKRDRAKLAKAQRSMSRKKKGSSNRRKARLKVARIYGRIADRRRDHQNKLSTRLIRENQVIVVEDLAVKNMAKNHNLARSISDASWAQFRQMLEYKARWYGREVIAVDRFFPSSKTCSTCGRVSSKMSLSTRMWTCLECGSNHDRDINAALNILAVGLAASACGDEVSPALDRKHHERAQSAKQEQSQCTVGMDLPA